jgi:hypothetical protein
MNRCTCPQLPDRILLIWPDSAFIEYKNHRIKGKPYRPETCPVWRDYFFVDQPIVSAVPPAASIFSLAAALNAVTLTVSFLLRSALPMILTPSQSLLTALLSRRACSSTTAPSSNL